MHLINKYAQAFLNVYEKNFSFEDSMSFADIANFLYTHRRALFLLKVPMLPDGIKKKGLKDVAKRFNAPQSFDSLVSLLFKGRRIYLIADVLRAVSVRYEQSHAIIRFKIKSPQVLTENQKNRVEVFLAEQVSGTLIYTYIIDPSLIAGIRAESDTLLWDCSLDRQLRELTHANHF